MRRRVLNLLTALSLLLCVAVVALWVRSRWVADRVECILPNRGERTCGEYALDSTQGNLVLTCRSISFERPEAHEMYVSGRRTGFAHTSREAYNPVPWSGWLSVWETLGFRSYAYSNTSRVTRFRKDGSPEFTRTMTREEVRVQVPHWAVWLPLLAGGWPLVRRSITLASRSLPPTGHCPSCGYDLRATPNRCPECGDTPAGAAT